MITAMAETITTTIIIAKSIAITIITTATPMLMTANNPKPQRHAAPGTIGSGDDVPAVGSNPISNSEAATLYRLMTWLSPSFPVGAFSYSGGIEWAVEAGDIRDGASLRDWLGSMLTMGSGFCDSVFLAHAHRAASSGAENELAEITELAASFASSRERRLETLTQGKAFIEIAHAAWNCGTLDRLIAACGDSIVYPIAVGVVGAAHEIVLEPIAHAFLHAVVSNWISAAARLVPLGQTDSQRVLAALEPAVAETATRALKASLDDLGGATFRVDLAGMRHETQYTRLFRS